MRVRPFAFVAIGLSSVIACSSSDGAGGAGDASPGVSDGSVGDASAGDDASSADATSRDGSTVGVGNLFSR